MTRTFSGRIAEHGVGMGIFQFLRILWEENGLTQSELAARTRIPLIASGGIGGVDDLHRLQEAGAAEAVLGMALYTGALDAHTIAKEFSR